MENFKKEKVTAQTLMSRLAALALAAALALGLVGCDTSSIVPGGSGDVMPNPAASQTGTTPSDGQDAAFQMHFIDVGQALSVLVQCDGQFMLYDGGNVDDGSLVVSYLQNQGVEQLEYVFCSHAHEDHVGGLAAALAYFPAYHVYSPVTEASTKCFKDFVKYTQQQNLQVEVPAVGTQWALGSATVTLLGRAGCCRVSGVQLAVRHKALGAHGEVLAVAADGDGALQVGAVDVHLCVPQDA